MDRNIYIKFSCNVLTFLFQLRISGGKCRLNIGPIRKPRSAESLGDIVSIYVTTYVK